MCRHVDRINQQPDCDTYEYDAVVQPVLRVFGALKKCSNLQFIINTNDELLMNNYPLCY